MKKGHPTLNLILTMNKLIAYTDKENANLSLEAGMVEIMEKKTNSKCCKCCGNLKTECEEDETALW